MIDLTRVGKFDWNKNCLSHGGKRIGIAVILDMPEDDAIREKVNLINFADGMRFNHAQDMLVRLRESRENYTITTHNTAVISNDILRPDCYFVWDACKKEAVPFYLLTNRELRFAHNLEKMYRAGDFDIEEG